MTPYKARKLFWKIFDEYDPSMIIGGTFYDQIAFLEAVAWDIKGDEVDAWNEGWDWDRVSMWLLENLPS